MGYAPGWPSTVGVDSAWVRAVSTRRAGCCAGLIGPPIRRGHAHGEVPEWPIGAVSKTVVPSRVPWVRIPPSPPTRNRTANAGRGRFQAAGGGKRSETHRLAGNLITSSRRTEQFVEKIAGAGCKNVNFGIRDRTRGPIFDGGPGLNVVFDRAAMSRPWTWNGRRIVLQVAECNAIARR